MTSSETHIMKLEKANAVSEWRNLMGATNPAEADAGTIRAKYGTDISMNATHGSDSNENAEIEINFFSKFYVENCNNIIFSSTIFSQVQTESWLDYVIEENKEEISETSSMNVDNEFYYTIQIAVKKTFDEAMEVVQALNASDIDAFIQKNDANSEYKYRVRYGNFSTRDDAVKLAENIKVELGYNCWIDKTEL